jgi:hypothetical protein
MVVLTLSVTHSVSTLMKSSVPCSGRSAFESRNQNRTQHPQTRKCSDTVVDVTMQLRGRQVVHECYNS